MLKAKDGTLYFQYSKKPNVVIEFGYGCVAFHESFSPWECDLFDIANQNNRPCDARWVAYVEECKKEKLRQRLFGKGSGPDNLLIQIGDSGGIETTGYVSAYSDAGGDVYGLTEYLCLGRDCEDLF